MMDCKIMATTNPELSEREIRNAALAREAAAEGYVLLKNDGVLPFANKRVALFGPGGRMTVIGGGGSGAMNERYKVSIEAGLKNAGFTVATENWLDRFEKHYHESYDAWKNEIERRAEGLSDPMAVIGLAAENRFPYPTGIEITQADIANSATDTAIYVLIRQGGEGADRMDEKGDYRLDDLEYENLKTIAANYAKTLLVVNVGGLIDLTFLNEIPLGGILFLAQGGMESGNAFADIVSGKVSPSGKLACTWADSYADYPGHESYSQYGDPLEQDYKEGIFVGYRYFDSFEKTPRYEFGFGLSYTSFDVKAGTVRESGGKVLVDITVTNTGGTAGKEVVQVYATVPRRACNAEYQRLMAFQKTKLLNPREKQDLTVAFDFADCASYYEAAAAYILGRGIYIIRVGNSSRNTKAAGLLQLRKDVVTERCENVCKPRGRLSELSPGVPENKTPVGIKCLPVHVRNFKTKKHAYKALPVYADQEIGKTVDALSVDELASLTVGAGLHAKNVVTVLGVSGNTTSGLYEKHKIPNVALSDGPAGLNVTPEIVQTPEGEVKSLKMYDRYDFGMFGRMMRKRLGKPEEGVVHYQYATAWPVGMCLAQTWNTELIERIGRAVGDEMKEFGVSVWLAPGMNLYRNPLCGRTFEYYSEDPVVAGRIAAAMTKGVQSHRGLGVSVKHFACNNQERSRDLSSSNLSERALRELYLRSFRIVVQEAKPKTVMASYNKINGVYNTNNYDLLVKVLRCEWGFDGLVMSDWNAADTGKGDVVKAMEAQCDLLMPGKPEWREAIAEAAKNGSLRLDDLKRCAARVLRLIKETNYAREDQEC